MIAHFLWATWAICSGSLICLERSEGIAHSRSLDLRKMSKWANSQPWSWPHGTVSLHNAQGSGGIKHRILSGLGIRSTVVWANGLFLAKKWENERFPQTKTSDSLIFGEQPEQFAHGRSFLVSDLSKSLMVAHFWWATWAILSHCLFLVSDLSDSLKLLTKKEVMSESLIFFKLT